MQRNRLLILAGAAAAAAIIVVALIVVLGSGGGSSSTTTTVTSSPSPASSLAGIPQRADTLGKPGAAATVVVFEDPQCPYCREWNVGTLPNVLTNYVRTGRINLVYRGIPIIGPNSVTGLRAIYAAGQQNKLWNLVEALYARQGEENSDWITDAVIRSAAEEAGADADAILKASSSAGVAAQLRRSAQEANRGGVRGTPTFVVERPLAAPQQLQLSSLDYSAFSSALESALQ